MPAKVPKTNRSFRRAVPGLLAAMALSMAAVPAQADGYAFIWSAGDTDLEWGPCPDFLPEGCGLAVLQGNPAEHNADVFFRLPGNSTADRHWHSSAERMVLVAGEMRVSYDDQDPVSLLPGTYAYGPARLPHIAECVSEEDCILFIAFEEPVDAVPGAPD